MPLPKQFDSADVESRLYEAWEKGGCFKPSGKGEPFCVVIPPPNVTGSLHMGHALNTTLQDILVRFERMRGKDVLWQVGTDHAGIATQMVVERQMAEKGEKRTDLSREEFIERVWEWKAESGGKIQNQFRRLGASVDWSRERFTMDEGLSAAVRKVFVQLYEEGLIYRAKRLVNWDPKLVTAISDLEVETREVQGHMWHVKYPLAGGETYEYVETDADGNETLRETRDYIAIATTRPETILGDGAVAVHPDDQRYAPLVGKLCEVPVGPKEHRRLIPIITDEYPDPDFGSGAVKITGAHDQNDYGVAKRAGIPLYRLMDEHASMRADGAPYAEEVEKAAALRDQDGEPDEAAVDAINLVPDDLRGLDRYGARWEVIGQCEAEGTLIRVEDKTIQQPFGDRSGVVIEPMLTDQWWVDAEKMAGPAIEAVRSGKTRFVPENWDKTYYQWMENIEPWCISRQLWWGHRVPVWYGPSLRKSMGKPSSDALEQWKRGELSMEDMLMSGEGPERMIPDHGTKKVFCAESSEKAFAMMREYYPTDYQIGTVELEGRSIDDIVHQLAEKGRPNLIPVYQDEDVLDTWFSSALWPFSTLGWPEETSELERFYPTAALSTAFDIIFFWVARMMMMGLHFQKEVPFKEVYIHAIVRDEHGQKMSKSKGNVVDPLGWMDTYGTDALRFCLAAQATQGRDLNLSEQRVEGYRNFRTKIWNAARFVEMNEASVPEGFDPAALKLPLNRWIAHEATEARAQVTSALEAYRFDDAAQAAYRFTWNLYCDWALELSKPILNGEDAAAKEETKATLAWALDRILVLLHPFMPFVTEELWAQTGERDGFLMLEDWSAPDLRDEAAAGDVRFAIDLISEIRSLRAEMNVPPSARLPLVALGADAETQRRLKDQAPALRQLARIEDITLADTPPQGAAQIVTGGVTYALPVAEHIDLSAELARLEKEIGKTESEIGKIDNKLANEKFVSRAPKEVVDEQHTRRADFTATLEKLQAAKARLEAM
ncbi:valine--tRNA ligase [Parvularcula oceani]|uniref:valine--tRNA ligase n=1 Tax=Parvularcula oceani TaxID=1247963 RepID=UPI0004E264A3|nr:valine--tRNA ligase [Parvularcula oceani]